MSDLVAKHLVGLYSKTTVVLSFQVKKEI